MCGRFALAYPRANLIKWYHAVTMPEIEPRYNIAPSTDIVVIRDSDTGREGSMMHWGLIPPWAKDPKKLPLLLNARAESLAIKPIFKHAFRRQRCLIPASGFYEWKQSSDGKSKKPFYISSKDGPLSFAGLWETATVDEVVINSCTIITASSNELMRTIHDRMPVILPPEAWDTWLTPSQLPDDALMSILMKPLASEHMQLWAVSPAVGRVSNQGEQLIQPVNE